MKNLSSFNQKVLNKFVSQILSILWNDKEAETFIHYMPVSSIFGEALFSHFYSPENKQP